jgi:hypothetical protein
MNFEQTITEITPTLEKKSFSIVESRRHYTKFQSSQIAIAVSYHSFEHSFSVFVGRRNGEMNELTDNVYLHVFGRKFQQMDGITFAEKFIHFLEIEGKAIMENDIGKVDELESYCKRTAEEYTASIINRQNLEAADRAWSESNYRNFIASLDKVAVDALPKSYNLKRKIALQKMEEGA